MTDPTPDQQRNAELLALQCVGYIKDFINVLRSIPEFDIVQQNKKRLLQQNEKRSTDSNSDSTIGELPLYTRIKETTSLCPNIKTLYTTAVSNLMLPDTKKGSVWNIPLLISHQESSSLSSSLSYVVSERTLLLQNVLLPLLDILGMCYEILDQIRTPSPIPSNNNNNNITTTTSATTTGRINHTTKLKPVPPIGMLSLQNYTDIAGFIEFIICNCVVPIFPPNIVIPIQDRVKYHLPKALAGRIPRLSLLWLSSKHYEPLTPPQHDDDNDDEHSSATLVLLETEWEMMVCLLGRLLLLDRFRPMLLPRHVTDIMAMILYRQEFCTNNHNNSNDQINMSYLYIVHCWTGIWTTSKYVSPSQDHNSVVVVDTYWRVKAYQGLLRNGRATPLWLRKTVAERLIQVATVDVSVVITVFVHEALDQDYSSAALRLAQALVPRSRISSSNTIDDTTMSTTNDDYFSALCEQLVVVLDSCSLSTTTASNISLQNGITIETIWAVLDLLPRQTIDVPWFQTLVLHDMNVRQRRQGNTDVYDTDIDKIIRRLVTLFSIIPINVTCVSNICYLFFRPLYLPNIMSISDNTGPIGELCLLGIIIRLATSHSILKSTVKDNAIFMLQLFINAMVNNIQIGTANDSNETNTGLDVLVVALLRSVASCSFFDSEHMSFALDSDDQFQGSVLPPIQLHRMTLPDDAKMDFFVKGVEDRVKVVIRVLRMTTKKDNDGIEVNKVISLLFQTLLTAYFCPTTFEMASKSPSIFTDRMFPIVTMVSLPLICEECPPEILLSLDHTTSVFDIMAIVIDSAMTQCLKVNEETSNVTQEDHGTHRNIECFAQRMLNAEGDSFPLTEQDSIQSTDDKASFENPDNDIIVSMTSVILGLLVSLLELGAKTRSVEQEAILQTFVPDLLVIANSASAGANLTSDLVPGLAQIAELASLAAATIVSRRHVPIECETTKRTGEESTPTVSYLQEAEHDLGSDLPPLRARAMVQLRHRVNAISERTQKRRNDDSFNVSNSDDVYDRDDDDLFQMLVLCMKALNDTESYVYLAAIHTIVAVADADPTKWVPIIGIALVTGMITHHHRGGDDDETYDLSLEQRTKLTEAFVFIVRRRNTFYSMLPFLMDLLVLGLKPGEGKTDSEPDSKYIHDATHRYFVTGSYGDDVNTENENEVEHSLEEYWKEVDLRVRTGGPLFQSENADVVRSGMMLVVSEVISILSTTVTARYAPLLISCSIDTLRWEASRPVRRAGATLARELYGALVREQDVLLEAVMNPSHGCGDVPLSMAMVQGREEILYMILQRIVSCDDRGDDPALVARCHEAISWRTNADQGGILLAGKVAWNAKQSDDATVVSHLLFKNKNNNNGNNTSVPRFKIQEL